jgi:hypothetical protein
MSVTEFNDFGKLYKAAFAEREPQLKLALLRQVQKAIEKWMQQHAESPYWPGSVDVRECNPGHSPHRSSGLAPRLHSPLV